MTDNESPGDLSESLDLFVQQLIDIQGRLRAFIVAALGSQANAADVLQKTNMVIWKKAKEFRQSSDLLPWALSIARYEVLAFVRDYQRDRHVFLEDVTTLVLDAAASEVADPSDRQAALHRCLEKLPERSRVLLWQRYRDGKSIQQICTESGRTKDSVKSRLLRIRRKLETCVKSVLRSSSA
jgi:RNA polymerase sigma-70 factor (ECF subfamily)